MTINLRGRLLDLSVPKVMGILNLTPDSFYDGGKYSNESDVLKQVEQMLADGADIIDIGGMSSRPGAEIISADEELKRVAAPITTIVRQFPQAIISIDTLHAKIAAFALEAGAHIINDISAGRYDEQMLSTVAKYKAPFVIMHMKGQPTNMQQNPAYENVMTEVLDFFAERIADCRNAGITDMIIDPGFGFGKRIDDNYTLLKNLGYFGTLNCPILAGVSRKSMISKVLHVKTADTLNGTTALNMVALSKGAKILRVHDIKEAVQAIKLYERLQ